MKIFTPLSPLVQMAKVLLIALLVVPQALVAQCIYADFSFTLGANGQVTFTDISGNNNTVSRTWSFGDGAIVIGNVVSPVHRYNLTNATTPSVCFDVTLTIFDGVNSGVSQPKQVCIPTSTQSGGTSLFVKIISPIELYDGVCNINFAKLFVATALDPSPTAFEASVLGGTPPYTFKWNFPPNTSNRTPSGQGPHTVTFTSATTGTCAPDIVTVEATDARGVKGTASVKISVRPQNEGPGAIKVVASKSPICVNEEITFKIKIDNPFALNFNYLNVSAAATYRWIVDGVGTDYGPLNRIPLKFTTAGQHTVGVEITDGGTTYRATPAIFTVQRLFIVEAAVADWDGTIAKYSMLAAFDAPLTLLLPENITRCKGDNVSLNNNPSISGGKLPYIINWTYSGTPIFKVGTSLRTIVTGDNPLLNLTNLGALTSLKVKLAVIDANGCKIDKDITIKLSG